MNWDKVIEAAIAGLIFTSAAMALGIVTIFISIATLMISEWAFYGVWFIISALFARYWYKKMEDNA